VKKGCVDCGKENVVGCYGSKVHRTDPWTLLVYGISTVFLRSPNTRSFRSQGNDRSLECYIGIDQSRRT
jgi:hypothetical protein